MKLLSNFSGAGLLDAGLIDGGNELLFQCEYDDTALEVLRRTFKEIPKHSNIMTLSRAVYKLHGINTEECAFVGGCPCQQHSKANPRRKIMPESKLLYKLVELCEECKPRFLLVENVDGFATDPNGLIWLSKNLNQLGYRGNIVMFPAKIFGASHKRLRQFALYTRDTIIPVNEEQTTYIENFKKQRISMEVKKGFWHDLPLDNDIAEAEIRQTEKKDSYENLLQLIGNAVVYDVALFIGKSLKILDNYFYASEEGQKIKKVNHQADSDKDLSKYWQYVCTASLVDIATKLGLKVKFKKSQVKDSNDSIYTLYCSTDNNSKTHDTPLASDGKIKKNNYTKVYKVINKNAKDVTVYPSAYFNSWLMGLTACPKLLKNIFEVTGISTSKFSKFINSKN